MSSDFAISLDHVSKSYRLFGRRSQFQTLKSALLRRDLKPTPETSVSALHDVTFDVHRGEAFGIIGRNGSGKSTLLKLISGILKPTEGKIVVDGRISALIELGAGFHPEISGRENVYINGIMLGLSKKEIDKRFDRIIEFAGIGEFLDQPVKTYSSGMYVRLGFAVAVHVDPDILLIDEVLAVGDEEFAQKCISKIQEMKYRGATLLFVTHQLSLVRELCDRAVWLDHGAVAALGDPIRVVDDYLQRISGVTPTHEELTSPPAAVEIKEEAAAAEATEEEEREGAEPKLDEEERWGSGEVVLSAVRLVDDRGRQIVALAPGSAVAVEADVRVKVPQRDFVFGVGIYHADGACVYGTNTDIEGFLPDSLEGDGLVRIVIPSLDLVGGSYRLDVAVHTKNGRAFDYRRGAIRFVVGSRYHEVGVYRPAHEWRFEGGITFRKSDDARRNVPAPIAETLKELAEEQPPNSRRKRKKE